MKILVNSKQIFEGYTDSVNEKYDCEIVYFENGFEIKYNNTNIVFLDDVLNVITEGSCLKVESNKVNSSVLKTPYGDIKLEITGEYIKWIKEPFLFEIRYKIKMEQTKEYINELHLQIID